MKSLATPFRRPRFPATSTPPGLFFDDFERADENPLGNGNWNAPLGASISGFKTVSGDAVQITGGLAMSVVDSFAYSDNQRADIIWNSGNVGPIVRAQIGLGASGYTVMSNGSTSVQLFKVRNFPSFVISALDFPIAVSLTPGVSSIGLKATGASLVVLETYIDDILVATNYDSSSPYAFGLVGMFLYSSGSIEAFNMLDFPPPPPAFDEYYRRPGGSDRYYRPGGIDLYIRP